MSDSTIPNCHDPSATNRANSQHSTSPRTRAGELHSSLLVVRATQKSFQGYTESSHVYADRNLIRA